MVTLSDAIWPGTLPAIEGLVSDSATMMVIVRPDKHVALSLTELKLPIELHAANYGREFTSNLSLLRFDVQNFRCLDESMQIRSSNEPNSEPGKGQRFGSSRGFLTHTHARTQEGKDTATFDLSKDECECKGVPFPIRPTIPV